ncbi:hypothetical protein DLE54_01225 [Psychrobacter sp. YP14]|uniref:glycosyltransferase family 4 protein n=1 Tax=Psychrobacter sp. YP14 TaxID=2203895 RepID=UPI000D7E7461|nr:glycosyltransferase family 4 protein [Psychrobacter sp. YP14]AWT48284.1 hypothetical protein DLE54_01225 [Psychrobacter sp. YP14]
MKILVLGYLGYMTNQLDGQTIKTRNIYSLFKKSSDNEISYFDTQIFQKSKLNLLKLIKTIIEADIIYYLPAQKNLKYIFPIVWVVAKTFKTKLNYLVVGGWLMEFLEKQTIHKYLLSRINGIYVETDTLYEGLLAIGFNNVFKLHNFRITSYPALQNKQVLNNEINIVFMARINPQKGVRLVFDLAKAIEDEGLKNVNIDIYGPISTDYSEQFYSMLENSSVNYLGVLNPEDINTVLQKYDFLLFPTKYYTEGFPGTILDAYISGLPVICTNWLNAIEFVENGKTGYITPFNNDQEFIKKVIYLVRNPDQISIMKENVMKIRHKYSAENAWDILKKSLT